ncbi:M15 family metallopeptidase [Pseudoalteromonas sp. SMS1]|uniref:M15 family metallopeptidase n=1 Tax=Pseudoalteromonas sp. SMS1 TaxID=2908894 RepID=UPI001F24FFAE|nr:M15 family metallopeptidase [Pseudoalteromonas sp. SMS1]MCF2857740.1 M15 family metallopeptidase [Pseudoalteromonas sp. SMS1]
MDMRMILGFVAITGVCAVQASVSEFVDIKSRVPSIETEIRYFGEDNFVGKRIDGYLAPKCLLSQAAARGVMKAQQTLSEFGLGLKVFDCYRPQPAVDHFVRWAKVLDDKKNKAKFYPDVPKSELFERGYIAARSGHSRGSTLDVTLVDLNTKQELNMGSEWDYFSPVSWPSYQGISASQRANRMLLAHVMRQSGFIGLSEEWWHFTLANEPHKDQYFSFPVQ